ncbi:MAG: hypothetical protein AABZ12_14160 [Planctomycetota bacterium]
MMKSKSGSKEENLPRRTMRLHHAVIALSLIPQSCAATPAGTWLERGLQCVREATSLPSGFQARGGCCYSWPAKGGFAPEDHRGAKWGVVLSGEMERISEGSRKA